LAIGRRAGRLRREAIRFIVARDEATVAWRDRRHRIAVGHRRARGRDRQRLRVHRLRKQTVRAAELRAVAEHRLDGMAAGVQSGGRKGPGGLVAAAGAGCAGAQVGAAVKEFQAAAGSSARLAYLQQTRSTKHTPYNLQLSYEVVHLL
jgi:hypothetical protein